MYKTSGTVTLKTLCSVQAFRGRKRQRLIRIIEVVLVLFGLFLLWKKMYLKAALMLALFALYLFLDIRRVKKVEEVYRNRLIENGNGDGLSCSSEIGAEGIRYSDDIRGISGDFPYSSISAAVCFEDLLVLYTKGIQMIFAFPKQLAKGDLDDLLAMLSGHGIKVKKCSKSVL